MKHFACFSCRKGFKKAHDGRGAGPRCPQCGAAMTRMGPAFRAPRQDDRAEWKKVEALRRGGVTFQGRHDLDTRELVPTRSSDVPAFVAGVRAKSRGEKSIERSEKKPGKGAVPLLKFLQGPGHAPFARKSSKRITVGEGPDVDVLLDGTLGVRATLAWRPGPSLFLIRTTLPKHTEINGKAPKILPRQLHPYDVLTIGAGRVVLDW